MGLLDKIAQLQQDGLFGERAAMRDTLRRQQALSRQDQLREQAALLKPTLSRFGAETAQQVGSLLLSDSPNARAMGAEQLAGLMESAGNVSPAMQRAIQMAQAQQQGQVLQNTATAQGITQASAMAPLQQQQARNAIALQQEQLTQQRAATAAALEAAKPQQSLPYG